MRAIHRIHAIVECVGDAARACVNRTWVVNPQRANYPLPSRPTPSGRDTPAAGTERVLSLNAERTCALEHCNNTRIRAREHMEKRLMVTAWAICVRLRLGSMGSHSSSEDSMDTIIDIKF